MSCRVCFQTYVHFLTLAPCRPSRVGAHTLVAKPLLRSYLLHVTQRAACLAASSSNWTHRVEALGHHDAHAPRVERRDERDLGVAAVVLDAFEVGQSYAPETLHHQQPLRAKFLVNLPDGSSGESGRHVAQTAQLVKQRKSATRRPGFVRMPQKSRGLATNNAYRATAFRLRLCDRPLR